ncbi:MAG: ribonuclease Z [Bacteroidales bacterium]|nr:ribonuclease Z [Bacteroidales bacterium]
MEPMSVYILGCGSALPTRRHLPSAQVLSVRGKLFLIDCGEGTQLQFRHTHLNYNKILDVFISHLHGDHCFGLIGLISTMGMLGRHAPLTIHAPSELETLMRPHLDFFCNGLPYEVIFKSFNPATSSCIYEDRSLEVFTLPLNHRIQSAGFLFKEKPRDRHLIKEWLTFYDIPLREYPAIKAGADYITPEGETVPNAKLTKPATPNRSYAYVSDTTYHAPLIPLLKDVDLLYHEATFAEAERKRAKATFHSTAADAGRMAAAAGVKRLILGHFSARYHNESTLLDEAKAHFGAVELADEGLTFEI